MEFLPLFLLLFAALAFGWFYWQRAKARTVGPSAEANEPAETPPTT